MSTTLPELPYAMDALAPHMSQETLEYHYGKHHQAYVNNFNNEVAGTPYDVMSLENAIEVARNNGDTAVFNNAAQIWNHSFFWNCLTPGGSEPSEALKARLQGAFSFFEGFKEQFTASAIGNFGSGWTWLVANGDELEIVNTSNAETPVGTGKTPLLTVDVWEHAYYIDHRNLRPSYLKAFWSLVNWDFVESNLG